MFSPVRLFGESKLPVGVNVSVNGCLSLYVSPLMNNVSHLSFSNFTKAVTKMFI